MATLPSQMFKSKELACLKYNLSERVSVIEASSLDSSKDGTLFAAGVSKRVHVYNFGDVMSFSPSKLIPPKMDVKCANHIRCLRFSKQHEHFIVFGDSQGQLHCINDGRMISISQGQHEGAVRSVCYTAHGGLISGAEDNTVKIWCLSTLRNMYTIKASNCPLSVCTHPSEPCIFAYATSDSISGIDLRNPKLNLFELSRCDEPFTYVEFISSSELIIRTDDGIKLWDIESKQWVRSYVAPSHERRMGTRVFNDMIACGSESNSVMIYSKDWRFPRLCHVFKKTPPQSEADLDESVRDFLKTLPWWNPNKETPPEYISSICWKDKNHITAACSAGYLYVLKICYEA